MRKFKDLFMMTLKEFSSWWIIVLLVALLALSYYSIQTGIKGFKQNMNDQENFKKVEIDFFRNLRDYLSYSFLGYKSLLIPTGASIFFIEPELLSQLTARANSIANLDIYNNCKGGNIFKGNAPFKIRFSNLIYLVGSLLVLALGLFSFIHREFLKTLSTRWHPLWVFIAYLLCRIIIFSLVLLLIYGFCLLIPIVQGLPLTAVDYINFFMSIIPAILMLVFFYAIGTIAANIKPVVLGIVLGMVAWLFFIFCYPAIIDTIIENKSYNISSSYCVDSDKLAVAYQFEKRVAEEFGEYTNASEGSRQKVIDIYLNEYLTDIEASDERQKQSLAVLMDVYFKLNSYMPTTFYQSSCIEFSSRGYQDYIAFYSFNQETRRRFVLFWIDRVYNHDKKVLVNFITADENIFRSIGQAPPNFWGAVLFNLIFCILLFIPGYLLFKRQLAPVTAREIKKLGKVDVEIEKGDVNVWLFRDSYFMKLLYNLFTGKLKYLKRKVFNGEVVLDYVEISGVKNERSFAYICHPGDLPGQYKVRDIFKLYAHMNGVPAADLKKVLDKEAIIPLLDLPVKKLENEEKFDVTMGLIDLCRSEIMMLNDIAAGMPLHCGIALLKKIREIKDHIVVILLVDPDLAGIRPLEKGVYFARGISWESHIAANEYRIKSENRLKEEKERIKNERRS